MFDTHCHLNFKAFSGKINEVIETARNVGVNYFVVPGTDVETSKKAVKIAEKHEGVYAAVGIHPHHIYEYQRSKSKDQNDILKIKNELEEIERLLGCTEVLAIGEVGVDRHYYSKTRYTDYQISKEFIKLQKHFFIEQIKLAHKYKKALIIHNREAKKDLLKILADYRSLIAENRSVFHCCEPDSDLLEFAKRHKIFLGVDGDITYRKDKQEFSKNIPLDMLVLETDSPYLLPEPLRAKKNLPAGRQVSNEPKNLKLVASFIAKIRGISVDELLKITEANSKKLFQID